MMKVRSTPPVAFASIVFLGGAVSAHAVTSSKAQEAPACKAGLTLSQAIAMAASKRRTRRSTRGQCG